MSPHLHPRPPVPGLLSVSLLHTSPTWVGLPAVGSPSSSPSSLRCLTWRSWSLCVQHHIRLVPGGARVGPLAHSLGTRWNTGHDFCPSLAPSGTRPCANSSCGFSLNVSPLSVLQAEETLGVEKALRRCFWLPVLPSTCQPGGLESCEVIGCCNLATSLKEKQATASPIQTGANSVSCHWPKV